MVDTGLDDAISNLYPVEFELPNKDKISLTIDDATISYPAAPLGVVGLRNQNIYPTECKQRGVTYRGKLCIRVSWSINGRLQVAFDKDLGDIPIMIKVSVLIYHRRECYPLIHIFIAVQSLSSSNYESIRFS